MYLYLILLVCASLNEGKVGFMKDKSMDAVFPAPVRASDSGLPTGHLRPLGYQRRPTGKVAEEEEMPGPQELYDKYVKDLIPGVFKNAIKESSATDKWDDEDKYLLKNYGDLNVHVTVKKQDFKSESRKISFKKFLRDYMYDNLYLTNTIPHEMMSEIELPKCLRCGTYRKFLVESEIWISSGGTASLLHYHGDHNLHCVYAGRKDFILIDPKYKKDFDVKEKSLHAGSGYSELDMDMINMFKYENIANIPWTWATLKTGSCIYVPAGHLHQVRSHGRSVSTTVLWSPTPGVDTTNCIKLKPGPVMLSDANFLWTYTQGSRQLTNAKLNAITMKHHLLSILRSDKELHFERFEGFYNETLSEVKEKGDALSVFRIMDTKYKRAMSRDDIMNLTDEQLDEVAQKLNKPRAHAHKHDEL